MFDPGHDHDFCVGQVNMPEIAPRDAKTFLANPDMKGRIYIFFGPDSGLVSDRAQKLAQKLAGETGEVVRFHEAELDATASNLLDGLQAMSMFADRQVYHLPDMGRRLDGVLQAILQLADGHHPIVVEAAGKGKGDKIIKDLLKSDGVYLMACYRESARDIAQAIDEHLRQKGHKIDQDAFTHLTDILGEDHLLTISALESLELYLGPSPTHVTTDMVVEALGVRQSLDPSAIFDAMMSGRAKLVAQMTIARQQDLHPAVIMSTIERDIQTISNMHGLMDQGFSGKALFGKLFPKVHFSRQDSLMRAARLLGPTKLREFRISLLESEHLQRRDDPMAWGRLERLLLRFSAA